MLLAHSAGLSGLDTPAKGEALYDHDDIAARLGAQAPWWEPGSASGYHALTQGYLLGEVVRRTTGKTLGTVFREEIANPLGIDFHIGTPTVDPRIGDLIPPGRHWRSDGGSPDSIPPTKSLPMARLPHRLAPGGLPATTAMPGRWPGPAVLACRGALDGKRILAKPVADAPSNRKSPAWTWC